MYKQSSIALAAIFGGILFLTVPSLSHHSFAMYDQTKVLKFSGVVTQFVPQANHAEIHFVPLGADGKPMRGSDGKYVQWGVELAGAAAVAGEGITAANFPANTIISVSLNPLRDGKNFGTRVGPIVKCPKNTPPPAGKHCDEVDGNTRHGRGSFGGQ